jgi:sugar O-acyltransferase (sialic acid O-acetyltransferase NeuD family)
MSKKLSIIGTGGFAKEVYCLILDLGLQNDFDCFFEFDDFFYNNSITELFGKPIKRFTEIESEKHKISIAISNSTIRENIVNSLSNDIEYATLIHPNVILSKFIEIGEGSIICSGSILTCDIKIGKHSHLNLKTTVGHDCTINDFFTTAPNVSISGNCIIDKHVYFGTSSMLRQGLTISNNVTVGMGAVVTKNIIKSGVYIGNPAKELIK